MSVASLGPALVRDTAMSFTSESTAIVPPSIVMPRSAVVSANAGATNTLDATTKPATAAPVRASARFRSFMLGIPRGVKDGTRETVAAGVIFRCPASTPA